MTCRRCNVDGCCLSQARTCAVHAPRVLGGGTVTLTELTGAPRGGVVSLTLCNVDSWFKADEMTMAHP